MTHRLVIETNHYGYNQRKALHATVSIDCRLYFCRQLSQYISPTWFRETCMGNGRYHSRGLKFKFMHGVICLNTRNFV